MRYIQKVTSLTSNQVCLKGVCYEYQDTFIRDKPKTLLTLENSWFPEERWVGGGEIDEKD